MTTAAELTRTVAAIKRLQPLDRFQSLMLFGNGSGTAVFAGCSLRFDSFEKIERLLEYQAALHQGINGEGI
jgi:hypothetical protein